MEKKQTAIDRLIEKYLNGNMSDEDYIRLTEYLQEKPENMIHFDHYKHEWISRSDESEKSWLRLKSKIVRLKVLENKLGRKIHLPYKVLRVASVLVIGLVFGAVISSGILLVRNGGGNPIVFNAPKGEKSVMILPDSSKVWLNGGTVLTANRNFGISNRKIELTGEAYFEVTKNKRLPLIVTTGPMKIRVLGTKFNVSAYADQQLIETTLKEGIIELSPATEGAFRKFIMQKNQIAVFDKTTSKLSVGAVDVETKLAWKNNQLIIENENYLRVFKKLENWYGVKFTFENIPLTEPNYSMTIKTESLREILELISIITPIRYDITGENVTIHFK